MTPPARSLTIGERALSCALRAVPLRNGTHRLLDAVRRTPWVDDERPVRIPYAGTSIAMDARDLVGWHFCMLRSFDPEVSAVLLAVAHDRPDPVLWDIGANKGVCSYAIASARPDARVVAIEPQPDLAELTRSNLDTLAPGRFEVHAVGVGPTAGSFTLAVPAANRGAATLVFDPARTDHRTVEVSLITATDLLAQSAFGWPTLVKIDVEGFEPDVITTLEPCLAASACEAIVFENHHDNVDAFAQIHERLTTHGYAVHAIRRNAFRTWLAPTTTTRAGVTDYAALRDDVRTRPAVQAMLRSS